MHVKPATPAQRSKASRLRAKRRRGKLVSADRVWLEAYELSREQYARRKKRPTRAKLSAREEAVRWVRWLLVWLGVRYKVTIGKGKRRRVVWKSPPIRSRWELKPTRKVDGIARAGAKWRTPVYPTDEMLDEGAPPPPLTNTSKRRVNVRVRVRLGSRSIWTSLIALTREWRNVPADVTNAFRDLEHRKSLRPGEDDEELRGITAVSVQVGSSRKD